LLPNSRPILNNAINYVFDCLVLSWTILCRIEITCGKAPSVSFSKLLMHIYVRSNPYFRAKFDENMAKSAYCLISFLFLAGSLFRDGQLYAQDTTVTWQTCLQHYKRLDEACNYASLIQIGETDQGQPLHCFVINSDGVFEPEKWSRDKVVLLINNNIHPGEPDGVESSMQLSASLCNTGHSLSTSLKDVIVCIIPMYNVDGAMVRSGYFRANQNGPKESGFRGNALNLDLNRDFIKCDSQNALTFCNWFTRVMPHVMIDTAMVQTTLIQ
jgi:hypothetical protein